MSTASFPSDLLDAKTEGVSPPPSNVTYERSQFSTEASSQGNRFLLPSKKEYSAQYFNIYKCRINQLRRDFAINLHTLLVEEGAPEIPVFTRIIDQHPGQEGIIIGHVMKDMAKKPCILDEYDKDFNSIHNDSLIMNYCSDEDSLALEDEYGKVSLVFPHAVSLYTGATSTMSDGTEVPSVYNHAVTPHMFVTGMVLGVQGTVNEIGELVVHRVFLPSIHAYPAPPPARSYIPSHSSSSEPAASASFTALEPVATGTIEDQKYIAIVSDLGLGSTNVDRFALQQCLAFLQGGLGSALDEKMCSNISRIIIAGNSTAAGITSEAKSAVSYEALPSSLQEQYTGVTTASTLTQFDHFVTSLASAAPVTLLPGFQDPSNYTIPQQPFHQCILPVASTYTHLQVGTNPFYMVVNDRDVLVTDGHNITDITRFSNLTPLEALTLSLHGRIIAPTAPDTYGCYPFKTHDPLVMELIPDIYIAGGQKEASWRQVVVGNTTVDIVKDKDGEKHKTVLLVTVPSFAKTKQIVLVNPKTFDTMVVQFEGLDDFINSSQ